MKVFDRLTGLRPWAPFLTIAFMVISIGVSAVPAGPGSIAAWVLFALLGIVFLRVAFPRSFLYAVWLVAVYILVGAGVLLFNGVGLTGAQGVVIGILVEVIALYILYHLIFQVKGLRDVGQGPYVPLGLWSMAVLLFFVWSNGAMASLVGWARSGGDLTSYIAFEVLLVLTVMFIFVRAEECVLYLQEGARAMRVAEGGVPGSADALTRAVRSVRPRSREVRRAAATSKKGALPCPVCASDLRMVRRRCPHCDSIERTAICRGSNHVFIPCPSCGIANYLGDYRCKRCGAKLGEGLFCRKCGKESELHMWTRVRGKMAGKGAGEGKGKGRSAGGGRGGAVEEGDEEEEEKGDEEED